MTASIVLFTRDLRVHDNPALAAATATAEHVIPLFVIDPRLIGGSPGRAQFLEQCLIDLRDALRSRGADLVVRQGDPVGETMVIAAGAGATRVFIADDVSRYAQDRLRRLERACSDHRLALTVTPGSTVVGPGQLRPASGTPSYQVFTPYWRVWRQAPWRGRSKTPRRLSLAAGVEPGPLPEFGPAAATGYPGGEREARRRLTAFLRRLPAYDQDHDALASDGTSRLSPYLRFGCLSALELVQAALATEAPAAEAFVRQVCWRDFFYQVAAVHPQLTTRPLRAVAEQWRVDPAALDAWRAGQTGIPLVDAGMRQLQAEGWMHNRARLVVASYLTKQLGLDWREGAAWFARLLLDGDVANNYGNWQWVAGTGHDTKPYRRFNPTRQGQRYDPDGAYVRRYVPELAAIPGAAVHEPWHASSADRRGYPSALA